MQNKPSRVAELLAAAAALRGDTPLVEFRDENERLDFSIEMSVIDMRANLWKIGEQLKLLQRYRDRNEAAAHPFTLGPSPLALSQRPRE